MRLITKRKQDEGGAHHNVSVLWETKKFIWTQLEFNSEHSFAKVT